MQGGDVSTDRPVLQAALTEARRHVLGILEGLSDEQLRTPVLPSGWTCVGLVNHLAVDVERFWFRAVMAGDQSAWDSFESDGGSAWDVDEGVSPASVLTLYGEEARQADQVITATSLDAAPAAWPKDLFGSWRLNNLREIIVHVIRETACHAGHLDAVREILDLRQWVVLDGGRESPD
jgi:uncharacterized damage-inducible protein DinB